MKCRVEAGLHDDKCVVENCWESRRIMNIVYSVAAGIGEILVLGASLAILFFAASNAI
jgi:hypothetical protein